VSLCGEVTKIPPPLTNATRQATRPETEQQHIVAPGPKPRPRCFALWPLPLRDRRRRTRRGCHSAKRAGQARSGAPPPSSAALGHRLGTPGLAVTGSLWYEPVRVAAPRFRETRWGRSETSMRAFIRWLFVGPYTTGCARSHPRPQRRLRRWRQPRADLGVRAPPAGRISRAAVPPVPFSCSGLLSGRARSARGCTWGTWGQSPEEISHRVHTVCGIQAQAQA